MSPTCGCSEGTSSVCLLLTDLISIKCENVRIMFLCKQLLSIAGQPVTCRSRCSGGGRACGGRVTPTSHPGDPGDTGGTGRKGPVTHGTFYINY